MLRKRLEDELFTFNQENLDKWQGEFARLQNSQTPRTLCLTLLCLEGELFLKNLKNHPNRLLAKFKNYISTQLKTFNLTYPTNQSVLTRKALFMFDEAVENHIPCSEGEVTLAERKRIESSYSHLGVLAFAILDQIEKDKPHDHEKLTELIIKIIKYSHLDLRGFLPNQGYRLSDDVTLISDESLFAEEFDKFNFHQVQLLNLMTELTNESDESFKDLTSLVTDLYKEITKQQADPDFDYKFATTALKETYQFLVSEETQHSDYQMLIDNAQNYGGYMLRLLGAVILATSLFVLPLIASSTITLCIGIGSVLGLTAFGFTIIEKSDYLLDSHLIGCHMMDINEFLTPRPA